MSIPINRSISGFAGRKSVTIQADDIVSFRPMEPGRQFLLVLEPRMQGVAIAEWITAHRETLRERLKTHGAILFRGFEVKSAAAFRECAAALSPELLNYLERAAPRKEVHNRVYTSTEYPADESIPLHHEMSYSHMWPLKIWFYCAVPATGGGATPIADDREIFDKVDARIREIFQQKKVMYVRNFGEGADLSWMEVFQTDDRGDVERYCAETGIEFEWRSGNRLRTRQVRQAVMNHPETGDLVWFNHAHLFHVSNLKPEIRSALSQEFRDDELPRNAFFGDGSAIPDATLEQIRRAYSDNAVRFEWRAGDLLLLDNMLASHGRDPFIGDRQTLVAMAEMYTNEDINARAGGAGAN